VDVYPSEFSGVTVVDGMIEGKIILPSNKKFTIAFLFIVCLTLRREFEKINYS
jgi:hypothetical protein